ncbi:MAG: hypothetical protein ACJ8D6_02745 [Sphingomicrobium sp.]
MIDFAGYSYAEHKATIACSHVLSGAPVLVFVHDEEGDIHFMCGESGHGADGCRLVGLTHLLEHIRSMPDIPVVEPGYAAERREPGAPWSVSPVSE